MIYFKLIFVTFILFSFTAKANDVEIIELKPDFPLSVSDIYGDFKGTKNSKGSLITKGKNYIKDLIH